jgi:hypothetical protein
MLVLLTGTPKSSLLDSPAPIHKLSVHPSSQPDLLSKLYLYSLLTCARLHAILRCPNTSANPHFNNYEAEWKSSVCISLVVVVTHYRYCGYNETGWCTSTKKRQLGRVSLSQGQVPALESVRDTRKKTRVYQNSRRKGLCEVSVS